MTARNPLVRSLVRVFTDLRLLFAGMEAAPGLIFIKVSCSQERYRVLHMNAGVVEVDARGLEPPQPMVRILEALNALPAGTTLRARTDRRPVHLYALLAERGYTAETVEQTDGSFLTHIRRA